MRINSVCKTGLNRIIWKLFPTVNPRNVASYFEGATGTDYLSPSSDPGPQVLIVTGPRGKTTGLTIRQTKRPARKIHPSLSRL